ncbi:MAG: iron-siderophore ABC transporter substrate-binding protein [Gordonia sp. (in: high G+C Gram-positive bacteria)]
MAAIVAIAALLLSGCSDDASTQASPSASATSTSPTGLLPAAQGATQYPLTLKTAWGQTTLEKRPERIAVVNSYGTDVELLASIGVTPVLAPDTFERSVWTLDALPKKVETVYPFDESKPYPYEAVAAAKPDLIIVTAEDIGAQAYQRLSTIAPVLAAPTSKDTVASWQDRLTQIGQALDLSDAAKGVIANYDKYFADVRAKNPKFAGLTATYLVVFTSEWGGIEYYSGAGSTVESLFQTLGFKRNPLADKFGDKRTTVSPELLSSVDADVLIVANNTQDVKRTEFNRLLTEQPLYKQLSAVQKGHAVVFDNTGRGGFAFNGKQEKGNIAWALGYPGPLSTEWAAGHIVSMINSVLN